MSEYILRNASPVITLSHANTSDEENHLRSNSSPPETPLNPTPISGAIVVSGDAAGANSLVPTPSTGSSGRKPRGRPPGSKNKPKPPVVITRDSEAAMRPVLLEVASGTDVITSLTAFSLRRHTALSVLSGTGAVSNVTIRLPDSPTSNIILQGRFDLLSLSGTVLLPTSSAGASSNFAILMCGPQGQVFGGNIAGPLMAADTVMVVAAVYSAPEVHRLPLPLLEKKEADMAASAEIGGEGGKVKPEQTPQPPPLYVGSVGVGGGAMARPEMALWAQPPAVSRAQY